MRDILFRGKTYNDYEEPYRWIEGFVKKAPSGSYYISTFNKQIGWEATRVVPETVGQFSTVVDCNAKNIFDGDIVRYSEFNGYDGGDEPRIGVVVFKYCAFLICYEGYGTDEEEYHDLWWAKTNDCELEVIGNIFDTPELLTEAK